MNRKEMCTKKEKRMGLHFRFLLLVVSLIFVNVENCSSAAIADTKKEVEVITEPRPGEEFVFVQPVNSQHSSSPSSQAFTSHQIPSIKEKQETTKAAAVENAKFKTSHAVSRPAQVPVKQSKMLIITSSDTFTDKKRDARETNKNVGKELAVSIEDEGQTGIIDEYEQADSDERKILVRKAEPVVKKQSEKKETSLKAKPVHEEQDDVDYDDELVPRVAPESEKGTIKKPEPVEDEDTLPKAKPSSTKKAIETVSLNQDPESRKVIEEKFEIVSVGKPLNKSPKKISDEGTYDFVDTPLNDKILKPSGSSQASRVNIKKAANGQDYEYEYVYYYYDDDEEAGAGKGGKNTNAVNSHDGPAIKATTPASHARVHPTTARNFETTDLPDTHLGSRSRRPEFAVDDSEDNLQSNTANAKQRYTTIERTKGHQATELNSNTPTTPEPASNEVLPTRGSRFRSRQLPNSAEETVAPVSEERLPANTRFPPRSRSNHNSNPTTPSPVTDSPITRVRANTGNTGNTLVYPFGGGCYCLYYNFVNT